MSSLTLSHQPADARSRWLIFVVASLVVVIAGPVAGLVHYALADGLHSHILLVPLVSVGLLITRRRELPCQGSPAFGLAAIPAVLALIAGGVAAAGLLSFEDRISLSAFSVVCLVISVGYLWFGSEWMRAAAFPAGFLFFAVPLPAAAADILQALLVGASAAAVQWIFALSGMPFVREGLVFHLPGIALEVGPECSGLRSTWILLITSVLSAGLFLTTPWKRALMVGVILPLGVLRNAIRIWVIALLCTGSGPQMIDHWLHRKGGPLFFAASLIPFAVTLIALRLSENTPQAHSCK